MEIGVTVLVPEKILRGFTIYGHGGHLGHVANIILNHFHFLVCKILHLVKNCPVVSEESKF